MCFSNYCTQLWGESIKSKSYSDEKSPTNEGRHEEKKKAKLRLTEFFNFDLPTPWRPHPVITLNDRTARYSRSRKENWNLLILRMIDLEIVPIQLKADSYTAHMHQTEGGASKASLLV